MLTSLTFLLVGSPLRAESFVLRNVQRVDVQARSIARTDVAVVDGRIAASGAALPPGIAVVDMTGKWLIPGLVDLHVHTWGNALPDGTHMPLGPRRTGHAMLYAGVTAMLDLAGDANDLFAARATQRAGGAASDLEADLYAAGAPFGNWNLPTAEGAAAVVVDYVAARQPDVVKFIYDTPTLAGPPFRAAMQALAGGPTPTVVHIGTWEHARDALLAGASAITHLHDDEVIPSDVVKLWGTRPTRSIPTMAVQMDLAHWVDRPQLLDAPLLTALMPRPALDLYRRPPKFSGPTQGTLRWQRAERQNDMVSLHLLVGAGVMILAGSDTNNLGTVQGYSLHRELLLLRAGGLGAWETLAAGTTGAAAFLRRPTGIELGEVAEFVVLEGDPLEDVANTQNIVWVVHHGKRVDRQALQRKLLSECRERVADDP